MKRWLLYTLFASACALGADPILFADFEGDNYGTWHPEGDAFGTAPALGTLPGQMSVEGFHGKGLVNSFLGGDSTKGRLTSPDFTIERKYIGFLIGGGGHEGKTCMNLVVDGITVRTATGPNTEPGGREDLEQSGWDVSEFAGRTARLVIVDDATGGWGHINVDQVVFTDRKPAKLARTYTDATIGFQVEKQWLCFPMKFGAKKRSVSIIAEGKEVRRFDVELSDSDADWWSSLDISEWKGAHITAKIDRLPSDSNATLFITQSNTQPGTQDLYHEPLRPQFHFSAKRGWMNDPNGLVHFDGTYHLFFQHNPFGVGFGSMHWGHATSSDLLHWTEIGETLYPDSMGPMWSGSAVVDWKNTSGFGKDGVPPIVLIYTAAGNPSVQCLAYSTDKGRTFTKFAGNPVVPQISHLNRDPKVIWHEPSKRWVMVLYAEQAKVHTIHFFTSENLRDWTDRSQIPGFFECPDFFELPVDGNPAERKWVLTAASSEYMIGNFDGEKFTPETPKLPGHRGKGFYAAQTYSDMPDGRRVQIGWLQAASPNMPFNQCLSIPLELSLRKTGDGARLTWNPVAELSKLRGHSWRKEAVTLGEGAPNPLADVNAETLEVDAEFEPGTASVEFRVRGIPIVYDGSKQELSVNGHRAPAPLRDGKQRIVILADRTSFEVFASDGLAYVPMPVIPDAHRRDVEVAAKGAPVKFASLEAHELQPIWK